VNIDAAGIWRTVTNRKNIDAIGIWRTVTNRKPETVPTLKQRESAVAGITQQTANALTPKRAPTALLTDRRSTPTIAVTVQSTARGSMRDAASSTGLKENGKRLLTRLRKPVRLVE
jgi:hypothetical protein